MNAKRQNPTTTDGSMTLRGYARSRSLPVSTVFKALKAGRISRRPDGRLDPLIADAQWYANTRKRIDNAVPTPPPPDGDGLAPVDSDAQAQRIHYEAGEVFAACLQSSLYAYAARLSKTRTTHAVRIILSEAMVTTYLSALAEWEIRHPEMSVPLPRKPGPQ